MKCIVTDSIRYKVCPRCETCFIYDEEFNTYNTFDSRGNATLMVECPHCRESSRNDFSESLKRRINKNG